ncbi:galactose mutarotase-like domain-containing protein [Schizophyllum fasciatum]
MTGLKTLARAGVLAAAAIGGSAALADNGTDPLQTVNITAPDGSARASFIAYGARATSFWVPDRYGEFRDVLLGYEDKSRYTAARNYFAPIVGRYANRIRNGTFTLPISKDAAGPGERFQVPENEHNGTNSLHGGEKGFDTHVWSIVDNGTDFVSFATIDPAGNQGFPGTVITTVTYTLGNASVFNTSIAASATAQTPIMLSAHQFWNLEAYNETQDLRAHVVQIQSSRVIATDGNLIPNGGFVDVEGTPLDFREAKSIGDSINATREAQYCGTDCVGFDNAWVYDNNTGDAPILSVWSENSGIRLDVVTNQPALQIYTCNAEYNATDPVPRKNSQGGPDAYIEDHSCFVLEQESYLDSINNPEFGIDDIYGPDRPYFWHASYKFSVIDE